MEHVLLFPIYVLYFYISTSLSMCAVPSMAVFCSAFILRLPGMLFRYFLRDSEMVSVYYWDYLFYIPDMLLPSSLSSSMGTYIYQIV